MRSSSSARITTKMKVSILSSSLGASTSVYARADGIPSEVEMSGGRSGRVVEERRTEEKEIFNAPAPEMYQVEDFDPPAQEFIQKTTIERREVSPARSSISRSRSVGPRIVTAERREYVERSDAIPLGPMVLLGNEHRHAKDERAIRAEIKALEAEQEALKAEAKASKELRKADRLRREGRESGEMILYERETKKEKEKEREPDGGVEIKKDKKGRMSISVPSKYR